MARPNVGQFFSQQNENQHSMTLKTFPFLLCFGLISLHLCAQGSAHVLHVSGQVEYFSQHGAKPVLLSPGMELSMNGKVRCKASSSAKLLSNGQTIVVSGSKMRDLKDLAGAKAGENNSGFTNRFLNFVEESVKEGDSEEKLKEHHRQYMNKASGGVKGYASPTFAIRPLLISTGKMPAAPVTFQWRSSAGEGPYTFSIAEPGGKALLQVPVNDTLFTLDLKQVALLPDEEYEWSVTRGSAAKSPAATIMLAPSVVDAVNNNTIHQSNYKTSSPNEQQLMLAYAYEEAGCYQNACQIYAALHSAQPDNLLLRRVYAAFLARMDMVGEAVRVK